MLTIQAGAGEYTIDYVCTGCAERHPAQIPACQKCGLGAWDVAWPLGSGAMPKQELDQDVADELESLRDFRDDAERRLKTHRDLLAEAVKLADLVGLVGSPDHVRRARRFVQRVAAETGHLHLLPIVPCTGADAVWCPVHGNCCCLADTPGDGCPLHGTKSSHALEEG